MYISPCIYIGFILHFIGEFIKTLKFLFENSENLKRRIERDIMCMLFWQGNSIRSSVWKSNLQMKRNYTILQPVVDKLDGKTTLFQMES